MSYFLSISEFLVEILRCFYATGKTCLVPQHLAIIARFCSFQRLLPLTDFIMWLAMSPCFQLLFMFSSARCLPVCCYGLPCYCQICGNRLWTLRYSSFFIKFWHFVAFVDFSGFIWQHAFHALCQPLLFTFFYTYFELRVKPFKFCEYSYFWLQ